MLHVKTFELNCGILCSKLNFDVIIEILLQTINILFECHIVAEWVYMALNFETVVRD